MEKIRINAVLTSQPVFLSFQGVGQVSALVRGMTEYGQMTFCCIEKDWLPKENAENRLAGSTLAQILTSSEKDEVLFYVKPDEQGNPTSEVIGFINKTKHFGSNYKIHL